MDGLQLASGLGFALEPLFAFEGRASSMGYLPAGWHHFEIKEANWEVALADPFRRRR